MLSPHTAAYGHDNLDQRWKKLSFLRGSCEDDSDFWLSAILKVCKSDATGRRQVKCGLCIDVFILKRLKQFVLHKSGNFVKVTNARCGKALEEISWCIWSATYIREPYPYSSRVGWSVRMQISLPLLMRGELQMFRFMITSASCFMMGKAPMWEEFWKNGPRMKSRLRPINRD